MNELPVNRKQAWIVCIACSMIFTAAFGFFNNCTALLLSAIADDMGFSNSEISIFSSVKTVAFAAFIGFSGKLYSGKNGKRWLLVCGAACILAYAVMPVYTKIWQWYVSAAVFGSFSSGLIILASLVIPNWFEKDRGKAMSTAVAPAGLIGMLVNPLLSRIILSLGWRTACLLLCVPVAALFFPAVLFMYKPRPEGSVDESRGEKLSDTRKGSFSRGSIAVLALCVFAAAGGTWYNKMQDFMVQVASVSGYDLSVRATVASCLMFGNLFFKLASGFILDRLGVFRSFRVWYALIAASIVLMLLPGRSSLAMYAGAFLFGATFGVNLIGLPGLMGCFFKGEEYSRSMRFVSSLNYYVSAVLAFFVGSILDLNSGVTVLFSAWLLLAAVSMLLLPVLRRRCYD